MDEGARSLEFCCIFEFDGRFCVCTNCTCCGGCSVGWAFKLFGIDILRLSLEMLDVLLDAIWNWGSFVFGLFIGIWDADVVAPLADDSAKLMFVGEVERLELNPVLLLIPSKTKIKITTLSFLYFSFFLSKDLN